MHETVLSVSAQSVYDSLSNNDHAQFDLICSHLAESFEMVAAAGYISDYRWYTLRCKRYFDHTFPFIILFERTTMGEDDPRIVILVHLMIPAFVR